jgi:2-oxoglutarate ferredoxin oxidoreductase subunit alpha
MTEFVNLAGTAEIPIVVVDVQRAGPSTGMPTKTEQSDLSHAALGGPGEAPRIVIAPTSVEDCFYLTMKAFNLADKYQLPVILLSDQSLSHRLETIQMLESGRVPANLPIRPNPEELKHYKRYLRTEDGVSPMSTPGMVGGAYVATGIERDEVGMPNYDPENHQLNMRKRQKKLERAAIEDAEFEQYGIEDARIGIISWGSTTGAVRETVQLAVSRGLKVTSLHPKLLFPTPKQRIGEWLSRLRDVIVVEVNQTGQYQHILQAEFGRMMHPLHKATGLPFTPGEILAKLEEVAKHGR